MRVPEIVAALLLAVVSPSGAEEPPANCQRPPPMLWGDGVHDDYAALRDWAAGKPVLWAETGRPVPDVLGDGRLYFLGEAAPFKVFPTGSKWTYFAELDGDHRVKDNLYIENYMTSGNRRTLQDVRLKCTGACHGRGEPPPAPPLPSGCFTS